MRTLGATSAGRKGRHRVNVSTELSTIALFGRPSIRFAQPISVLDAALRERVLKAGVRAIEISDNWDDVRDVGLNFNVSGR